MKKTAKKSTMAGMTKKESASSRPAKKVVGKTPGKKATEKVMKQGVDGVEIRTNAKTKWVPFGR